MIGHHFSALAFCNAPSASGVCRPRGKTSTPRSASRQAMKNSIRDIPTSAVGRYRKKSSFVMCGVIGSQYVTSAALSSAAELVLTKPFFFACKSTSLDAYALAPSVAPQRFH
jgi:hypothetical protein